MKKLLLISIGALLSINIFAQDVKNLYLFEFEDEDGITYSVQFEAGPSGPTPNDADLQMKKVIQSSSPKLVSMFGWESSRPHWVILEQCSHLMGHFFVIAI